MAVPTGRGSARAQAEEAFLAMRAILTGLPGPQVVTFQTVFLKSQKDQAACERVVAGHYGNARPVTTYIHQPPCGGAAMSVEAWAIGGEPVRIERPQTDLTTISYDGITWTYCGGIAPRITGRGVYKTSLDGFQQIKARMKKAGVSFGTQPRPRRLLPQRPLRPRPPDAQRAPRRVSCKHRHRHGGTQPRDARDGARHETQGRVPAAAGEPAADSRLSV
ncbi:MAG: hypothetical protein HZB20_05400 [Chloroflexi bacterium]|nr:hypothetical protein [Chloroflexota bacterium]